MRRSGITEAKTILGADQETLKYREIGIGQSIAIYQDDHPPSQKDAADVAKSLQDAVAAYVQCKNDEVSLQSLERVAVSPSSQAEVDNYRDQLFDRNPELGKIVKR